MTAPAVPQIRPELDDLTEPIDAVTPYPGNARRGDLEKIKTSLIKHGQYKALLVQASTGHILIGNNTYAAMRELGYEHVAVQRLDVSEAKAKEMLLIDNASSDAAIYDESALAALLAEVEDWDASGFDPDDLDDLLVKLGDNGNPDAQAAALPPAVESLRPQTAPAVPNTDAHFAESDADQAKRQEKFDSWTPRYARGLTEVILVYPEDVRTVLLEQITFIRTALGASDARNGDVVLAAVKVLREVIDADRRGDLAVDVAHALTLGTPAPDTTEAGDAAAVAEEQAQDAVSSEVTVDETVD